MNAKKGYHLTNIPKGKYGEFSKVEEEVAECRDAIEQNCRIMLAVELADLLGAIAAFLKKEYSGSLTIDDLAQMTEVTKRAFDAGDRNASE